MRIGRRTNRAALVLVVGHFVQSGDVVEASRGARVGEEGVPAWTAMIATRTVRMPAKASAKPGLDLVAGASTRGGEVARRCS